MNIDEKGPALASQDGFLREKQRSKTRKWSTN